MNDFILSHELPIRLGFFFGMLILVAGWEIAAPRRPLTQSRALRWSGNLGIVVINSLVLRWSFPFLAVGMALLAEERGWGLLNAYPVPFAAAVALSLPALDLIIYLQHVMFHAVPLLWRMHRMHHADLDFDVTTGVRFHPFEIVLSMGIKLAAVAVLGAPAVAVVIFEVVLNSSAVFNHGNVRLPRALDRVLRWVVVTPDMHRVHHSILPGETNSNFGFNLPWWDRLFGTYRDQPREGHAGMTIGLSQFREARFLFFPWLLVQPFLGKAGDPPINYRYDGE